MTFPLCITVRISLQPARANVSFRSSIFTIACPATLIARMKATYLPALMGCSADCNLDSLLVIVAVNPSMPPLVYHKLRTRRPPFRHKSVFCHLPMVPLVRNPKCEAVLFTPLPKFRLMTQVRCGTPRMAFFEILTTLIRNDRASAGTDAVRDRFSFSH